MEKFFKILCKLLLTLRPKRLTPFFGSSSLQSSDLAGEHSDDSSSGEPP